ncbi:hypothetical protein TRICHSKD4_3761 [Roseibium sp. TrichSKD4]|uniref:hypothetical protein n=1 Tax=Roseibium sp. TrichSKD4 TaxID=744980 RepID=UPI0001E56BF4|nr:hypothetical protein [Roseibium sp. TrichSKD4]EFO30180.1 hypothetical protein TRICHSKD4_3761 [Roseibium sp. TrichSKD4]
MTFQQPQTATCNLAFSPETLTVIAQNLKALQPNGKNAWLEQSEFPLLRDWSKTLLPFPAIIGSVDTKSILEPAFAFSEDHSMALLPGGWFRLDGHVDMHLSSDWRIRG